MERDTDIGGPIDRFPSTDLSAIVAVRSSDQPTRQRAFEKIIEAYWKPSYKYVRIKWQASNENAKDLIQGFFATALEKNYFSTYDSGTASFQTFLRTCLDRFVANQRKSDQRLKRGGGVEHLYLDFAGAENELAAQEFSANIQSNQTAPDAFFHQEWVRSLLSRALDTLRERYQAKDKSVYFELFERYDIPDDDSKISYAELAKEFGISTSDVTNYLAAARREFRKIVLEKLRETTATDDEFRNEARSLLGVEIK